MAREQTSDELPLADLVCLALVAEGRTHGWALVKLLAPDGEIGRIWSLTRPLTYRSIDRLVEQGFVMRTERGRRSELTATAAGRRRRDAWLARPVAHLRDLRTEFLLQLALLDRIGRPRLDLVERQIAALRPAIGALTATTATDPVELWRQESAEAARRFLARLRRA